MHGGGHEVIRNGNITGTLTHKSRSIVIEICKQQPTTRLHPVSFHSHLSSSSRGSQAPFQPLTGLTTIMNADSDNSSQMVTIPPQLSRKLVQTFAPDGTNSKRVPAETASAVSELLRRFIVEARSRASIEVCKSCSNAHG
jgi:Sec7-like guanine-nucleotide exchange factor